MKDHSKRRHLRSLIEETKVDFCLMQEMNCERMEESFVWEIWGPMGFDFKWQLKPFVGGFSSDSPSKGMSFCSNV